MESTFKNYKGYVIDQVYEGSHKLFGDNHLGFRYLNEHGFVIIAYNMFTNYRIAIGSDYGIENG